MALMRDIVQVYENIHNLYIPEIKDTGMYYMKKDGEIEKLESDFDDE